jgi:DNA-binding NtrC family response regulator
MVPKQPTPFTVALINNSEDLLKILQAFLAAEGIPAVIEHLPRFKRGEVSIAQFLTAYDPRVVVWDIPPPYDANWEYFQYVQQLPEAQGRQFVLTTTNLVLLHETAGPEVTAIEAVGKPFDLEDIRQAIRQAGKSMPADQGLESSIDPPGPGMAPA